MATESSAEKKKVGKPIGDRPIIITAGLHCL